MMSYFKQERAVEEEVYNQACQYLNTTQEKVEFKPSILYKFLQMSIQRDSEFS